MNGVHDMGGMHGMGPIQHEKDEPVFHAPWEARTFAMTLAFRGSSEFNLDAARHALEQLPPAEYLRMSYYEKWFARLEKNVAKMGNVKPAGVLGPEMVPEMIARGGSARRSANVAARFNANQRVRARNIHPAGHTRLPRYARGKTGVISRDHGVFVFPDTRAHGQGEKPQHVYSVRFDARELWGDGANPRDAVYIDLWEDYLGPA